MKLHNRIRITWIKWKRITWIKWKRSINIFLGRLIRVPENSIYIVSITVGKNELMKSEQGIPIEMFKHESQVILPRCYIEAGQTITITLYNSNKFNVVGNACLHGFTRLFEKTVLSFGLFKLKGVSDSTITARPSTSIEMERLIIACDNYGSYSTE
jgi:hypothetical protein